MLLPDHVPSCDSAPGQQETGAGAAGSGEDGEGARRRRRKEERVKGQGAGIGEPGVEPGLSLSAWEQEGEAGRALSFTQKL